MNDGVVIILKRMETHPEEFYDDGGKWKFIYKEYFRDVMTEEEKAALHTKLKEVRRSELTSRVMKAITHEYRIETDEWTEKEAGYVTPPPSKKKLMRLNSSQLSAAQSLASRAGISFDEAVRALGYK